MELLEKDKELLKNHVSVLEDQFVSNRDLTEWLYSLHLLVFYGRNFTT